MDDKNNNDDKLIKFTPKNKKKKENSNVFPKCGIIEVTRDDQSPFGLNIANIMDMFSNTEENNKRHMVLDVWELMTRALELDGVDNYIELFDGTDMFKEAPIIDFMEDESNYRVLDITVPEFNPDKNITYIGYIEKKNKTLNANVAKRIATKGGVNYYKFRSEEKSDSWIKSKNRDLDMPCGLADMSLGKIDKNNGYSALESLLAFCNLIDFKIGITKKQYEACKILSKIYDENISILGCGIYEENNTPMPFLHPLDNDWSGFIIRVNEENELTFDFKTSYDEFIEEEEFEEMDSVEKELTIPLNLGKISIEQANDLVLKMTNLRKGIKEMITTPLSTSTIAISSGTNLEEKYENLRYEGKELTQEESENFNNIKEILEKNMEEYDE